MAYDIRNKVVLITGGANGIGFACVQELLRNGAKGITIAGTNKTRGENAIATLENQFGPNKVIFVQTDVTEYAQLQRAFETTMRTWKAIDIVINNAGEMKDCEWEREIAINCNAVVQGSLLGLKYMGKDHGGNGGVIVNLASILGFQPLPGCPIYVGTKHFVVGFDRSLGTPYHFERTGVKVLTMCPGVTDTPLISEAGHYALNEFGSDIGNQLAKELGSMPTQPSECIAGALIVLLKNGENGSCWLAEGNEPVYELDVPDRKTMRKY